jgi:hypothetical protein
VAGIVEAAARPAAPAPVEEKQEVPVGA